MSTFFFISVFPFVGRPKTLSDGTPFEARNAYRIASPLAPYSNSLDAINLLDSCYRFPGYNRLGRQ